MKNNFFIQEGIEELQELEKEINTMARGEEGLSHKALGVSFRTMKTIFEHGNEDK